MATSATTFSTVLRVKQTSKSSEIRNTDFRKRPIAAGQAELANDRFSTTEDVISLGG
jgi:hypothetical protein